MFYCFIGFSEFIFFFKQKTAYEIGLGIPAEPLFRSTDQTSLGQFSGRVQQTYKHSVPRFFVPEHGTMFTLALVRFPPTATKEIQYLNAKGALTYTDIAGDPVLYGNLRSEERFSRNAETDLVCRLLLEKKKKKI